MPESNQNWEKLKEEFHIAIHECRTIEWYEKRWLPEVESLLAEQKNKIEDYWRKKCKTAKCKTADESYKAGQLIERKDLITKITDTTKIGWISYPPDKTKYVDLEEVIKIIKNL